MNLIDRDLLKKTLCDRCTDIAGLCQRGFCESTKLIDSIPTVDAVSIVRCKDCIYFQQEQVKTSEGTYRNKFPNEGKENR